ncbi:hypothetical protein GLOTRDRAFT_125447 [Gloeophyllum trabeum ATCC 11539]|uniref:Uncharacterized protein n=1 Tax=Gloeophyllum trabeum (strain ATCC 11539 / FP-39264 / Madison 617) TaxID=670483 RepID=S7QH60_GLOTA|nr:uncharacterized protein GLOTRDRAFT_125447 [Gloeophyllum trabeum ATCC 11539]EPQ59136.1 hypothetical protein GLOTRDRAFT_125447 [Gloeophyllum trabeum ATCC 11539]
MGIEVVFLCVVPDLGRGHGIPALQRHSPRRDSPAAFIPEGGNPDDHLIPADAEIANLTPPKSLEDRVGRLHLVTAAMLVFEQYKVMLALADFPDLWREYRIKKAQRRVFTIKLPCHSVFTLIFHSMRVYVHTEFARLLPQSMARLAGQRRPHAPPATPGSPRPISREDINCYLNNPSSLVGRRFVQSSQGDAEDEEEFGTWYVASYTVRVAEHGTGIQNEYYDALGGAPIKELRRLLEHSVVAV